MNDPLEGRHYDRAARDYVDDVVSETPNPYTSLETATGISFDVLPTSPKGHARQALECGWDVRAWIAQGIMAPVLYLNDADGEMNEEELERTARQWKNVKTEHSAGDVRYDGYHLTSYIVEAREPRISLGFRAHYEAKRYADGRKSPAGSFAYGFMVDPIGFPIELRHDYKPIKTLPGKDANGRIAETDKSFQARVVENQAMADRLNATMNDGTTHYFTSRYTTAAKELSAWIAEWATYGPLTTSKDPNA